MTDIEEDADLKEARIALKLALINGRMSVSVDLIEALVDLKEAIYLEQLNKKLEEAK
jgi:hypothetical protein